MTGAEGVRAWRHCRWLEPHLAVVKPGSEVDRVRATGKPGAECAICGEALHAEPDSTGEGVRAELREADADEQRATAVTAALRSRWPDLIDAAISGMAEQQCDTAAGDSYDPNDYREDAEGAVGAVSQWLAWSGVVVPLAERDALAEEVAQAEKDRDKCVTDLLGQIDDARAALARAGQREARVREVLREAWAVAANIRRISETAGALDKLRRVLAAALNEGDTDV